MSNTTKLTKLGVEVNNGRLAMLAMLSFFCESKIPGSVPVLHWLQVVRPFNGQYLNPVSYWDFLNYFLEKTSDFGGTLAPLGHWEW
jgi:hypothetical protein